MMEKESKASIKVYGRIAGLTYIVVLLLGLFSVNFVHSKLFVPGNNAATINNISSDQTLFRIGTASEILMYVLVVLLSFSLYVILKNVNKNLAFLALLLRMGEAIIGSATVIISGLIPILMIENGNVINSGEIKALVSIFLNIRGAGLDIVLLFIGTGGTIFLYLFYRSDYVPKTLAVWGALSYIVIFAISLISILTPVASQTKLAFYAPGGVFEIVFGLWLLIRSVKVDKSDAPTSER